MERVYGWIVLFLIKSGSGSLERSRFLAGGVRTSGRNERSSPQREVTATC